MNVYTPTNVIVHEVDVHFESRIISKPIHVVQYDDRLPVVKVNLYTGNNGDEEYELPEGADVNIRYCRPDGHVVYNPVLGKDSTSNNVVYFEITQAMLIKNGKGRGVLEVTLNGKLACSSEIIFEIDRNPIQEDSIEATDEFKSVVQYATEAESAASSVRDLTVGATTGEPGSEAAVVKSGGTGPEDPYHLQFTIPKGESGSAGNISVVAEEYSASKTYNEGQYVIYNNDLYVAKVDISTAEAWNANHWIKLNIGDALYEQNVEMDHKADIDGSYEDLTAGSAEQLLSDKYLEDNTAYNFRRTADGKAVGNRAIDEIIGGTLVVNQQIVNGNFASTDDWNSVGGTLSVADNIATFNKTAANPSYFGRQVTIIPNHVYMLIGTIKSGYTYIALTNSSTNTNYVKTNETDISDSAFKTVGTLYKTAESITNSVFTIRNATAGGVDRQVQAQKAMLIDLTQWFSSSAIANYVYNLEQATAGSGVAWLYKYFPVLNGGYIPHNVGTLQSIVLSKHRLTEFNLFDADTVLPDLGFTKQSDGSFYVMPQTVNRKVIFSNRILQYSGRFHIRYLYKYASANTGLRFKIHYTDGTSTTAEISNPSTTFTEYNITSSANKIVRSIAIDYGSNVGSYIKDICISFSSDRDGEFEPYTIHEYALDSSKELRGIPQIDSNGKLYFDGDRYKDNVTRRWYVTDFNALTWSSDSANDNGIIRFVVNATGANVPTKASGKLNIISSMFETYTGGSSTLPAETDREMVSGNTSGWQVYVSIKASRLSGDLSTASVRNTAFKTWITNNNFLIMYELATPTTESAEAYVNPQVCFPDGSEEYVDAKYEAGERAFAIPTGHNTQYLQNLRQKLDDLPFAPSEYGDYLVRVSADGIAFIPFANGTQIPTIPTTDGRYDLVADVASGTVTLSWVLRP